MVQVLRTPLFEVHHYLPRDIEFGSWHDVVVFHDVGLRNLRGRSAPRVNLTQFNTIDIDPLVAHRCSERFGGLGMREAEAITDENHVAGVTGPSQACTCAGSELSSVNRDLQLHSEHL